MKYRYLFEITKSILMQLLKLVGIQVAVKRLHQFKVEYPSGQNFENFMPGYPIFSLQNIVQSIKLT